MKLKRIMSKVLAGSLLAGVILSSNITVFASELNTRTINIPYVICSSIDDDDLQSKLDNLISSGILTEKQASIIEKKLTSSSNEDNTIKSVLDNLVDKETITQNQESAILRLLSIANTFKLQESIKDYKPEIESSKFKMHPNNRQTSTGIDTKRNEPIINNLDYHTNQ